MSELFEFLPVSKADMESRGWWWYDFLLVTGDAYVDHPSFGPTVIGRVLEAAGYRVAILAPAGLALRRSVQSHGKAQARRDDRLRESGFHGGPLYRRQKTPQRGLLLSR